MDRLPPELINEILLYLVNHQITMYTDRDILRCFDASEIFNVMSTNVWKEMVSLWEGGTCKRYINNPRLPPEALQCIKDRYAAVVFMAGGVNFLKKLITWQLNPDPYAKSPFL